ncbi:MAG UNVERIFIED_CONTAM: hypothetical protein LVQ98_07840 [Rickettsiaceae bacterium]|jgi:3-oxoacyl-ACP reductase-like protein
MVARATGQSNDRRKPKQRKGEEVSTAKKPVAKKKAPAKKTAPAPVKKTAPKKDYKEVMSLEEYCEMAGCKNIATRLTSTENQIYYYL